MNVVRTDAFARFKKCEIHFSSTIFLLRGEIFAELEKRNSSMNSDLFSGTRPK